MSTRALPIHVALVDETGSISPMRLAEVAGALNRQVTEDVAPVWHVRATVGYYPQPPSETWTVRIRRQLDEPNALGYHTDELQQPVSYVMLTDDWPATASHEVLEMLVDPWGNRLHGGRLPAGLEDHYRDFGLKHATSHVSYLVEVADPPEAVSYDVGGVALSDWISPAWYASTLRTHTAYSHAGTCTRPRMVAPGGYVSFHINGRWWQAFARHGAALQVRDLGRFDRSSWSSLREFTDHHARKARS